MIYMSNGRLTVMHLGTAIRAVIVPCVAGSATFIAQKTNPYVFSLDRVEVINAHPAAMHYRCCIRSWYKVDTVNVLINLVDGLEIAPAQAQYFRFLFQVLLDIIGINKSRFLVMLIDSFLPLTLGGGS